MDRKRLLNFGKNASTLFVVITVLASCEIGLGPSVDTEAPTIEITYPSASATIKGEFTLAGQCNDDKAVTAIGVTVQNTNTGASYGPYPATIASNAKSWTVSLNQESSAEAAVNGWTFPDGKYEISVVANDASGHSSGTTSRAFEIDNSVPVFVITSPGATDISKATEYGSLFNIKGTIADDHSISSMTVTVYKQDGTQIGSYTESDIETAGGTSVNFARYVSGGTADVNKRYEEIYGTSSGTVSYYCSISLTDSAKTYTDPSEKTNETTGNTTSTLYLYDDVYTAYMSTKKGYGLEASDLKNILNGTLTGSISRNATTVNASEILTGLKSVCTDTTIEKKRLSFSLNPDASPRYIVNGYALDFNDETNAVAKTSYKTGTRNQNITIIAKPGLDGTLIAPATLKVYMAEYATFADMVNADGTLSTAVSNFISDPAKAYETAKAAADAAGTTSAITLIKDNASEPKDSSDQYNLTFLLPETIVSSDYYMLAVSGQDVDETAIVGEGTYGFLGDVSGAPPTISINSPLESSYGDDSASLSYEGVASSETSSVSSVVCEITVTDETKASTDAGYNVGTIKGTAKLSGGKWTFTPATDATSGYTGVCENKKNSGHQYLYTAKFTAYDEANNHMNATCNVHIDTLKPVVTITAVSPTVISGTKYCVNGTVVVSGTVNESSLSDVSYSVYIDGTQVGKATSLGAVYSFSRSIDTTGYTDLKNIAILFTATDKSGNTGICSTTDFNKSNNGSDTSFVIDQSTDYPTITPTNASEELTTVEKIKAAYTSGAVTTNIFGVTSNNKISYTLTDDDGVKTVAVQYKLASALEYGVAKEILSDGKATTCVVNYTLPTTEGLYNVLLTVTDTAGATNSKKTNVLTVAVDEGAPTIKVTSPSDGSYNASSFTVSGSTTDNNATMLTPTLYVYNDDGATIEGTTDKITATKPTVSNGTWTSAVTCSESNYYQILFSAEDAYGQKGEYKFSFRVDRIAPTFTVTNLGSDLVSLTSNATAAERFAKQSVFYSVGGTVADEGSSGIGDFMYYQVLAASATAPTGSAYDLSSGWSKTTVTKATTNTWSLNLDFSSYVDGTPYILYLAAKDNAGNVSVVASNPSSCVKITPDGTVPSYTGLVVTPTAITATNKNVEQATFTASGVFDRKDVVTGSGVKTVELYQNETNLGTMSGSDGTYTCVLSNAAIGQGTNKYFVRITDNVGNVSTVKNYATITRDTQVPTIAITGVTPVTSGSKMNGTVTVTATAKDETGLAKYYWKIYNGATELTATGTFGEDDTLTELYKGISFDIDTTAITTSTAGSVDYTLKMWAVDAAGNTSVAATKILPVDQSTDTPVISLSNATTTITASTISKTNGNLFNTSDNNKLLGVVSDDDGIQSITVAATKVSDDSTVTMTQPTVTAGSTTASLSCALPSAEGKYKIVFTVVDTKYADTTDTTVKALRTSTATYYVAVDKGAPAFEITTASGAYTAANATKAVAGTASDTSGLAKIVRYSDSSYSTEVASWKSDGTGSGISYNSGNWTDSFTTGTTDGVQYYEATDIYGNSAQLEFTYKVDATAPTFTITQLGTETLATALSGAANAVTRYAVKNSIYQIKGTVEDTGGSGLKGIYYYVSTTTPSGSTAYSPDSNWTLCTLNTDTAWTANIDLSSFTEETYTIYIAAVDEAGNVSPLALNPCKTVQIVPDAAAPVLAVTTVNSADATALATYYKGSVTVEGTLTETNLAAFTVTPSVTPSGTTITVDTTPASGTNEAWKFTIPATTADYSSIVITATDKAGQSTSKTLATLVDMDEPKVYVPQFGMAYWMNASTQTYTVPVSDKDGYTVYSDIASVAYALSQDGINFSTPVPMAKGSTDVSKTDYTDYNSTIAFADGTNTINVIVTDNAGNVHTEEGAKTYLIDTVAPTSTLTSTASLYTTTGADAGTTLASGGTYLAKGEFKLGGTITEATSGFTSGGITLSVTKDGVAVTDVTSPTEAGQWTYKQAAEDGLYVYTLSLTDQAGNKSVYTVTVRVDTAGPELVIKNPTAGDSISSPLTMQFSAPDSGSGLKSITYTLTKLAKGSDSAKPIATDKEASESGNTRTSAALDFTSSDYGEGTYTLSATAKDVLGNATTTSSPITFYYDKNPPTVTETGINTSGKTTNAAYILTGSASDSNELAATNPVTVVDKIGDTEQGTYYPGVSGGAWSLTLTPNGATADAANNKVKDGIHTYSITVKDVAGKTATITRTVTSDNTVPTWNTDSSSGKEPYISTTASNGYYKTTSISIAALASDATSGIAKLQYSTDGTNYSDTGNGSFTVNASEGSNTIYVRAVDAAGNMTSATTLSADVDTTAPASCELASLYEGGTKLDDTTFAAIKAGTSTLLVNTTKDIAFTVTDSDGTGSGIDTAKYAMTIGGSDAGVTYSAGTLTVAKGKLATGAAVLTVTDKAGNSAKFQLFQVQVDADAPVAAITAPAVEEEDSTTLNGKKTVSGTVTEAYTPESISLYYTTEVSTSLTGWQLYKAVTTKAGTTDAKTTYGASVASIYNWSMSGFDFTTLSGSSSSVKTIYLLPVAYDKAGNCNITDGSISSSNYVTYYVNQDADRPVIQFTNLTLTGMTSSNHIWLKNSNVVYGTIRDDDGITSLSYSLDAGSTWNAITVTNGTWSLSVDDGAHTIYFRVVDTEGTTFTSAASGTTSPKLYDGTTYFASDTLLYLSVDKTAPAVKTAQFAVYDTTTSSYGSYSTSYADTKFGGIHSKFNLQVAAKDTNGIASINAKFGTHADYVGVKGSTDVAGYVTYTISDIDATATYVADGSKTLTVTVTDGAGLTTINTFALAVDNTPPVISIINPSSQVSGAETLHGSVDSTSTVYYAVSSSSTTTPGTAAVAQTSTAWAKIIDASLSWNVYFDATESTTQTHADFLKYFIPKCSSVIQANIDNGSYKTLTTLYFWIKAVDESGNVSTANKAVVVDPQGDRPKVTLSYPAADGVRLGGTIRLIGTVSDNTNDAAYAWVQIHTVVSGETSSDFNATDQSLLSTNGYTLGNMTDNTTTPSSTVAYNGVRIALTGSSWNLNINEKGEFNPSATGTTNTIIVTVYATDAARNLSSAVTRTLVIDKDTPVIVQDTLKLVQYDAGSGVACTDGSVTSGTVAASRTYKEGMSIKGVWFLTGKITDDSGLKKIVENGTEKISAAGGTDSTGHFLQTGTAIGTAYNYTMNIPVGNSTADSVGTSSVTVTATENTEYNLYIASTFSVNYDNKAPVLTTSGDGFNISADIVNSDGFYTFGSVATEAAVDKVNQTGVERIAFYLTRDVTSPAIEKLYDVMIVKGGTGNAIASYKLLTLSDGLYWKTAAVSSVSGAAITLSATDENIHVGGLAKVNGTIYRIDSIDSAGLVITLSDEPGSATTAYFALANVVDNTTAEGKGTTMNTAGYYTDGTYDDGDLMMESIIKQSTSYTWEANINSKNISDGTIVLHYVVFDAAGNYSEGSVSGAVKNNQPRIAGVSVGTDYNADNTVSSSEWNTDNALSDTASYKIALDAYTASPTTANAAALEKLARKLSTTFDVGTAATPVLTAKGLTQIKPEIVGGNGALYYSYSDGSSLTGSNSTALVTAGTTDYTLDTGSVISLQPGDLIKSGDSANRAFTFKIWDSTEGMTALTDRQYATIIVHMGVSLSGVGTPVAYISPFYWRSASANSLYGNSSANGHIELEGDWLNASGYTSGSTSGTTDDDPKVSGKVVIRGTAHDDRLISAIYLSVPAMTTQFTSAGCAQYDSTAFYKMASYSAGTWTCNGNLDTYGFVFAVDTDTQSFSAKGHTVHWTFTWDTSKITNVAKADVVVQAMAVNFGTPAYTPSTTADGTYKYLSVDGATYYSDAAYAAGSASVTTSTTNTTDTTVYATLTEAAAGKFYTTAALAYAGGTADAAGLPTDTTLLVQGAQNATYATVYAYAMPATPYYRVDVVPYVTKVGTSLSKHKTSNPSVYNRTALGHYPVQSVVSNTDVTLKTSTSETVTLYGFNLNGNSPSVTGITTVDSATAGQLSFNAAELASGKPTITVSGITVINNSNNNDAHGAAASEGSAYVNWYNREGNGDTNNILNDDICFDVWEFNDRAAVPLNGLVGGVQMKINPQTKMLNYAFANGSLFYSMAGKVNGTDYSSYYWAGDWDVFTSACVGFTVDDLGYTYSSCSGGDTNDSGEVDTYAMWSSRWGIGTHGTGGTYGGTHAVRLEKIALKTGDDTYDYDLNKNRCLSPEYASSVSGTATNLYHIYYDAICDEIRFRAGTLNTTAKQSTMGFTDQYTTNKPQYYSIANCQVIANGDSGKYQTQIAGRGSGNYVAIAVAKDSTTSKDVVCVVWYDAYANNLKYSYVVDPITNWDSLKADATANKWSSATTIFAEGGEYCHIAVDKNNHIHIAAYAGNGDVKYAYLDTYSSADLNYSESENSCIVDASGTVGEHLTLDVALDSNGYSIPYIGYYTSAVKMPKYAYLVDTTNANHVPAGVDADERFTGAWEVAVVPTPSRITSNREDKVNVGVWKDLETGKITNSLSGTSTYYNNLASSNAYANSVSYSKTYGNGTSNGVLAYQIANGSGSCIETAQMR